MVREISIALRLVGGRCDEAILHFSHPLDHSDMVNFADGPIKEDVAGLFDADHEISLRIIKQVFEVFVWPIADEGQSPYRGRLPPHRVS